MQNERNNNKSMKERKKKERNYNIDIGKGGCGFSLILRCNIQQIGVIAKDLGRDFCLKEYHLAFRKEKQNKQMFLSCRLINIFERDIYTV